MTVVNQYDQRNSECGWQFRNYPKNIVEVANDKAYCLDAPDWLPLGGVAKTKDILYTHTYSRAIAVALSEVFGQR